jgi:hypothetical protein
MAEVAKDLAFEQISEKVQNPRQRESLERIKAAADYLIENEIKVSPQKIEKYCIDRGWSGPKAQSIRNSPEILFAYLKARSTSQVIRMRTGEQKSPEIRDESIRLYVDLITQERDEARAECSRIRRGLRSLPGISVDQLLSGEATALPAVQLPVSLNTIRAPLLAAIAKLSDANILANCGLERYKDRIRQQTTKNVLLEKPEAEAFQSLVKMLSTS